MKEPKIVVVSGEFGSGKTIFALTTGAPMEKVLIYDMEESSAQYEEMGFKRVNLPAIVAEKKPDWKPVDLFEAWREHMDGVEPGQYDVIAIDPISELESGLADWVQNHPREFGKTPNQYQQSGGLFWGDVKAFEKRLLLNLANKCQTLIVTAHMRNVWQGNKPTNERERKGKETLTELSDLELVLERKPNQAVPSANVVKVRMMWINPEDPTDIRSALPPRLPQATWKAIHAYMEKPPKWDDLADDEKVAEVPILTEDERLILQAQIAEAEARKSGVVYTCSVCGKPIGDHDDGTRVWTVDDVVAACDKKGIPPTCIPCFKATQKQDSKK